ncbi:hypothetical protein [Streptosporangium roseum]|uniref:hypothetical protein n=1 Tax=Streptosporangium roseum TaxID=2001 RepID=UPI003329783D
MKLFLTAAMTVLMVAAVSGTAQAIGAPPPSVISIQTTAPDSLDPVIEAIKHQFTKKGGVRFTAKTRERTFGILGTVTAFGSYRFSASGVHSSDSTEVDHEDGSRFHLINVGRASYTQDSKYDSLPKGKKWRSWRNTTGFLWSDKLVDGINTGFLALAASQDRKTSDGGTIEGTACTLLEGTVTVAGLEVSKAGVSFSTKDTGATGGTISWRLWVGPDHLPRRFNAAITWDAEPDKRDEGFDYVKTNKFYRQWGSNFTIMAPPKRTTISHTRS